MSEEKSDKPLECLLPIGPEDFGTHTILYGCQPAGIPDPVDPQKWYPQTTPNPNWPCQSVITSYPIINVYTPIICEFCKFAFNNSETYNDHIEVCKRKARQ